MKNGDTKYQFTTINGLIENFVLKSVLIQNFGYVDFEDTNTYFHLTKFVAKSDVTRYSIDG